jgi:hypothetical protein
MKENSSIILKITFLKHIKSLSVPLLLIVVASFIDLLLPGGSQYFIFTAISAVLSLPAFFLHIDYFIRNRQEEYEIGNQKIIRRKNGVEKYYRLEDIAKIYLYYPQTLNAQSNYVGIWSHYHYAKIVLKSGEVLYLTSLLYPFGLEEILGKYLKVPFLSEYRWLPATLYNP